METNKGAITRWDHYDIYISMLLNIQNPFYGTIHASEVEYFPSSRSSRSMRKISSRETRWSDLNLVAQIIFANYRHYFRFMSGR